MARKARSFKCNRICIHTYHTTGQGERTVIGYMDPKGNITKHIYLTRRRADILICIYTYVHRLKQASLDLKDSLLSVIQYNSYLDLRLQCVSTEEVTFGLETASILSAAALQVCGVAYCTCSRKMRRERRRQIYALERKDDFQ